MKENMPQSKGLSCEFELMLCDMMGISRDEFWASQYKELDVPEDIIAQLFGTPGNRRRKPIPFNPDAWKHLRWETMRPKTREEALEQLRRFCEEEDEE